MGEIPRFGTKAAKAASEAAAKSRGEKKLAVPIFFSHPWLRPYDLRPDTPQNIKAKKLVQFAMWYERFCFERTGIKVDVWYWIDYSCVDQDSPHPGIAVLPAFIAACEVVLTWQTPDFDRRCWTTVERMLAYSFSLWSRKGVDGEGVKWGSVWNGGGHMALWPYSLIA